MSLPTGHRLAHYEILEPIGKGGMGEVYRAKDSKLGRDVAIKVLPDEFAENTERLRRFQREAKVLASLNHPYIAAIYGVEQSEGTHYLVLELVPGETLAERIARGPIPVDEALEIAMKIATALEEAHAHGIVHRDLKPANIKLTENGDIKVLDFGLAKAFVEEGPDADSSMSPTLTRDATRVGVILGTAAYMSPEQAKGKRVDKRADVWAFAAVLYEMLTGKSAFAAEDVSETLAYVLTKDPNWKALPADTPAALRQTLKLCLTKDAKRRMRDICDVQLAMEGAFATAAVDVPSADTPRSVGLRSMVLVGLAGLLVGAVVVGLVARSLTRPSPSPVTRFAIKLTSPLLNVTGPPLIAISPDGGTVAYTGADRLYLRELGELESRPIPNTEGSNSPFFSPDGQWVGFQTGNRRALQKVSLAGGPAVTIAETSVAGASWGPDDTILFGLGQGVLMRVSAEGGEPQPVTTLEDGEVGHWRPDFLPNGPSGQAALFTVWSGTLETSQIAVVSLDTGERRILTRGTYPRYVPTGHILFAQEASLWAVPFDVERLEVTGAPVPVVDGVSVSAASGAAHFAVAHNGTLVYARGEATDIALTLVWVDRTGREEPLAAEPGLYQHPRISPDGTRIAVEVRDQEDDIWIWDLARETLTRLTFDPAFDIYPTWTPDGARVAFGSARGGSFNIFWKAADGTGAVEPLSESENARLPYAFSTDGRRLVFGETGRRHDLGVLTLGEAAESILASEFNERNAEISPDGRWLAFQSDASGRAEIYVRPFPNVDEGRWQISRDGGTHPVWSPDGNELFYLRTSEFTLGLMAVPIETEPTFVPANPAVVFEGNYVGYWTGRAYDIAPDGERFLMIKQAMFDEGAATELILVQNWFQDLERLVPTEN